MNLKSTLALPARIGALSLVQGFGRELALLGGFEENRINAIMLACEEAFTSVVARADVVTEEEVQICGELTALELTITFSDREMPPAPNEDTPLRLDADHLDDIDLNGLGRTLIRTAADQALWQSLGRDGNRLRLTFNRHLTGMAEYVNPDSEPVFPHSSASEEQEYLIRRAGEADDWYQIARAIYHAYGYTHPSDDIYYPDRLQELNRAGRLVSVVASTDAGEVVGHYALELGGLGQVAAGRCLVAETGMAVVHPAHQGRGLMERMRECLESEALALGLHGLFSQPVTSHSFSQQVNEKFGGHACALSLAFISQDLRFRSLAHDHLGQRESCLLYFKPLASPDSRLIYAPVHHREMLLETYRECGIPVTIAEDTPFATGESRVSAHYLAALDLGMIRIETVGADIATSLRTARNELCRQAGARVLYLTVRLNRPGAVEACAAAEHLGFFYGGLAPYFDDADDVLRLQYVDTALDIARLTVAGGFANRLMSYVENDRLRIEQL